MSCCDIALRCVVQFHIKPSSYIEGLPRYPDIGVRRRYSGIMCMLQSFYDYYFDFFEYFFFLLFALGEKFLVV